MTSNSTNQMPPVAKVEIYTWRYCPYCIRAKMLLNDKGVPFVEHKIDGDHAARSAMSVRVGGGMTLPQILINDRPIGGYTELSMLESRGELDALLSSPP